MWAGSAEVSILREALGEALVVFCMTFVGIVGMFKLAERSIERSIHVALLPVPVLGGREKGAARDTRGRGEVAPQYLAATGARRRGTHGSSSGNSMSAAGETIPRRNTWSSASLDSFLEASPDAPRLAATGARRRGPHDERSRDARARPESDGKSRKGSAPGLRRRSSTDKKMHTPARESLGGMRHSSCSNSECYTGEKLRRKLSCIEEVSSDAFTDASPHASL